MYFNNHFRKKSKKLQGKFKNVVGAAQKGALKGKKLKGKRSRMKNVLKVINGLNGIRTEKL